MPAIQSIGLASDTLKQDTIDKLKKADENAQIVPINKRITKTKEQNTELSTLLVSIAGMKGAQNPLYEENEYLKVATSTIGDSVNPIVSDGVSPQNINIRVKQLAQEDIIQSNSFKTKDDILSIKDTSMSISINSRTYEVKIKGSKDLKDGEEATKLSDLPLLILEATSNKVSASIINTGGEKPYTLILKSKTVGENNSILIGTIIKANKSINNQSLKDTVFKKKDIIINNVEIFGKISNTTYLGTEINSKENLPFQFNPGDLLINGVDIFNNTVKTSIIGNEAVTIDTTASDNDLILNGINIFDTSGFTEIKSNLKLDNIKFPFDVGLNTLTLNGIDIFDDIESTTITTAIVKDDSVSGIYTHNNLMINGVSIFNKGEDTDIDSVSSLIDYINLKTDDTSVFAEIIEDINGNKKIKLTNEIKGDNIDINTNDSLKLAKMRLFKGITTGSDSMPIANKIVLIDTINLKKEDSNVEAFEIDGHLVLRSTKAKENISLEAEDTSFINQIDFKENTYNKPIPVDLKSLDDVVFYINKKTKEHNLVASTKEDKLFLEHTKVGKNIAIDGNKEILTKLQLPVSITEPDKGKLVSSIEDLVDTINANSEATFVHASKENSKLVLKTTKKSTDIVISGRNQALALVGLNDTLVAAINGEVIEDIDTVVEKINEKSSQTNVQAFLGSDNRITLLNTLGENIVFQGDEEKLNIISFSTNDNIILEDVDIKKDLLKKLGISNSSTKLQNAQDSTFIYNGVEINRDTNSITDIITGVEFQLKKVDTSVSTTNISIKKDKETIANSFFEFITAYNSFVRKVSDLTKFTYDEKAPEESEVGVFQGKTTISNLPSSLSGILGTIIPGIEINSLISLGVDFSRDGTLTYEEEEIKNKINSNFEDVEKLFRGYTKTSLTGARIKVDGIFTIFNKKINDLTKGNKSVLETFKASIEQETGRLEKTLKKTQETIDNRYEQVKKSFIANDAAIGRINNNFSALKKQIEYETAKN
jgi:flagellar hook-associated protein 2